MLGSTLHAQATWYSTHLCPAVTLVHLQGESGKMSASDNNSAIFVNDTPKDIKKKVRFQGKECARTLSRFAGFGGLSIAR